MKTNMPENTMRPNTPLLLTLSLILISSSCSPMSYLSQSAGMGSLIGGGLGTAGGAIWAENDSSIDGDQVTPLLGMGVAALGAVAGAYSHEQTINEQRRQYVVREHIEPDEMDAKIERLRKEVNASGSWGRLETKSYEERYPTEDGELPYQGAR